MPAKSSPAPLPRILIVDDLYGRPNAPGRSAFCKALALKDAHDRENDSGKYLAEATFISGQKQKGKAWTNDRQSVLEAVKKGWLPANGEPGWALICLDLVFEETDEFGNTAHTDFFGTELYEFLKARWPLPSDYAERARETKLPIAMLSSDEKMEDHVKASRLSYLTKPKITGALDRKAAKELSAVLFREGLLPDGALRYIGLGGEPEWILRDENDRIIETTWEWLDALRTCRSKLIANIRGDGSLHKDFLIAGKSGPMRDRMTSYFKAHLDPARLLQADKGHNLSARPFPLEGLDFDGVVILDGIDEIFSAHRDEIADHLSAKVTKKSGKKNLIEKRKFRVLATAEEEFEADAQSDLVLRNFYKKAEKLHISSAHISIRANFESLLEKLQNDSKVVVHKSVDVDAWDALEKHPWAQGEDEMESVARSILTAAAMQKKISRKIIEDALRATSDAGAIRQNRDFASLIDAMLDFQFEPAETAKAWTKLEGAMASLLRSLFETTKSNLSKGERYWTELGRHIGLTQGGSGPAAKAVYQLVKRFDVTGSVAETAKKKHDKKPRSDVTRGRIPSKKSART